MGEAKFTPGPWATEGDQIETADGSALIAEMALWDADDEEAQEQFANARLIAAAPELLAALQEFMEIWNSNDATRDTKKATARRAAMWQNAQAAIRKATEVPNG